MTLRDRSATTGPDVDRYAAGIVQTPDGYLAHVGGYGGFHTWFGVSPDRRTSLVIACNLADIDIDALAETLLLVWI